MIRVSRIIRHHENMKKILFRILATLLALLSLPALYLLAALLLGLVPCNAGFRPSSEGVDIYIAANAVHTDLILPMQSMERDWRQKLPLQANAEYLAIGWGDRAFYLQTRQWGDLQSGTAWQALTGQDRTLLHVEAMGRPLESAQVTRIRITPAQYAKLLAAIDSGFQPGADGKPVVVPGAHYDGRDAFYEATGHYSLFTTCNEWARTVLDTAGIRTAAWAPFAWALAYQAGKTAETTMPQSR